MGAEKTRRRDQSIQLLCPLELIMPDRKLPIGELQREVQISLLLQNAVLFTLVLSISRPLYVKLFSVDFSSRLVFCRRDVALLIMPRRCRYLIAVERVYLLPQSPQRVVMTIEQLRAIGG